MACVLFACQLVFPKDVEPDDSYSILESESQRLIEPAPLEAEASLEVNTIKVLDDFVVRRPAVTYGIDSDTTVDLGTYRVTAYCACEICCGEWAHNRPDGIVLGASGVELQAGVSCGASLPFGTVLEIEGLGRYVVQDRMAQWVINKYGTNCVDIYFDSHEDACAFGLKYLNVKEVIS